MFAEVRVGARPDLVAAATPVSKGTPRTGFRGICNRRNGRFIDLWFFVFAVRTARYVDPRTCLLICPPSQVIYNQTYTDLTPLCDLAERLSGLFILARRVISPGGVPHNVTMPRSWFINLILSNTDLEKDTSAFTMFASTLIELMQRIDAQVQRYPGEEFAADANQVANLTGLLSVARM